MFVIGCGVALVLGLGVGFKLGRASVRPSATPLAPTAIEPTYPPKLKLIELRPTGTD